MAIVTVGKEDDLTPGKILRVVVARTPIALFNIHGELYAIGDTCTHEEFSLSDGEMAGDYTIECPLHGAQFDIRTGAALCMPATEPTASYSIWVEDGALKLDLPEA